MEGEEHKSFVTKKFKIFKSLRFHAFSMHKTVLIQGCDKEEKISVFIKRIAILEAVRAYSHQLS